MKKRRKYNLTPEGREALRVNGRTSKGRKHSPEARVKMREILNRPEVKAKMSIAHKGKKHSPEARAKMSIARKGKRLSPETRAKLSIANKGKKLSPEHRAKISEALRGDKNPNWLGGTSIEPYTWVFNEELKEEVRRRDNHKCQLCDVPQAECERKLHVHHIDYDKKNSDPVNLISLCLSCHMRTNGNREYWKALFQRMVIERDLKERSWPLDVR